MVCVVVVVASRTGSGLSWHSCSRQWGSIPSASELEGLSYTGSVYGGESGQSL